MTTRSTQDRLMRKLQEGFGSTLCKALEDPDVIEIMLNPDGRLFIERFTSGMENAGTFDGERAEVLIGIMAHVLSQEVNARNPIISGEVPLSGHRFEGLLPPAVKAPAFSIRRRAIHDIPLEDYLTTGAVTPFQYDRILKAIAERKNIVVCGGTGSGKTTLANALLQEILTRYPSDRIVLIEDTVEITCKADNIVELRSSEAMSIDRLLKSTLRLRPDRIMVGEVRDAAALTLLKAWNTGHPGGLTTLHANHASAALTRLEHLVGEATASPMQQVIADAVDLIICIRRWKATRRIDEVLDVQGFDQGRYLLTNDERTKP